MSKLSSGYWIFLIPLMASLQLKINILKKLNLKIIDDGYYFESDMLFNLYNLKLKLKMFQSKLNTTNIKNKI